LLEKFIHDKVDGRNTMKKLKLEIVELMECKAGEEPQRLIE
jgi:hypothetical protein